MQDVNIFKAELQSRITEIETMIVLLDINRPDLLYPLWDNLSGWIEQIDRGLETGLIQFK